MNDCNIFETLGQVSSGEAGVIFRNFLRGSVRQMISEVMAEEVTQLCGPKHLPDDSGYVRAGSSPGRVLVDGEREEVIRPRVRQSAQSAKPREVQLASYRAACDPEQLTGSIIQALAAGERAANLLTIIGSAIGNDLDVRAYLDDVLRRVLAGETDGSVLTPHAWKREHPESVRDYRKDERRQAADRKRTRRARRQKKSTPRR